MTETPHSIEAEQSVLGALLLDNDAVDRMGDLKAEHFYRGDHREIFGVITKMIRLGQPADVITVFESLTNNGKAEEVGGLPYLNALAQNTPSSANIGHYAEMVRDRALRRGLIAETSRLAELAKNPAGKSAAEVLDIAQTAIEQLAARRIRKEPVLARQAMLAHIDVMDGRCEGRITGIPTGLSAIDASLNGGINRGNLVIIGARPSMGKTSLSQNIATHVAERYHVLFLSQEMQTGELLDRAIASLGRINLGSILRGVMEDEEWSRFTAAAQKIEKLNLHIDDQPALTLLDVRGKANLIKRRHGLDLLIVDYLQLMSGEGDTRNAELEVITRGLKALAKELDIGVIALSQLNRSAAKKPLPSLSDLRDSGSIEQDADIVIFVHRDEVDNPDTHLQGITDVFVAKNRQGRLATLMLGYEGRFTQFCDFTGQRPQAPNQTQAPNRGFRPMRT